MFSIKINVLYVVSLTMIAKIQSLVEVSTVEDGNIKYAEAVIRNTTNELFAAFNIQNANWKPKVKQCLTIHDYFLSITVRDCNNLKKIVEILRVNDVDNNTQHLITKINEVLDEGNISSESTANDKHVAKYIDSFMRKIKHLKEKYVSYSRGVINKIKFKYLNNSKSLNVTTRKKTQTANDEIISDDNDDEYWKPSGRRLFRGFRTRIKHFPFVASVQFFKKFQCAGSIIKNDLVITSASCLQLLWNNRFFRENPPFISVQIGSDYYEHGGENIGVQEIYFYPTYDPKTLNDNLALMRLSRQINFKKKSRRVKKIDIDRNPSKWVPKRSFDIVTVVGWGARDSSNIIYNVQKNKLSYAELDYYPLHECQIHYSRAFVTKRNFCAGFFSKGGGACNRDAGGPAVINGILMGVISFGSPICGSPDFPTVFTKLGFYADWIDDILEQEVPHIYKRTTVPQLPGTFTLSEKFTSRRIVMNPMGTTQAAISIPNFEALRIPKKYGYDDFLSSEFNSKEVIKEVDNSSSLTTKLEEVSYLNLNTYITPEKITTQPVKVTAIIPIIESTGKDDKSSELEESEYNESNDTPIETGTESAKRITVLEKEKKQDIKNNVMALIDNLDLDELLNDMDNNTSKLVTAEEFKQSKRFINNLKQLSSLSSSNEDEEGLSIPMESLNTLPLKIVQRTHGYDKLSESLMFEIVSQAIEKEMKRQARQRKVNV